MTFLDKLERTFGRFAIPGLIRYIVALNALVFILCKINPGYANLLVLDPGLVMQGQVWRLVSWIFLPTTNNFLWIIFYLMFTFWAGDTLEATWGTFRLNLYYFLGMIGAAISAFLFGMSAGNYLLTFSLLLALATIAPNMEILFFFFPLKLKWVALIGLIPWLLMFVTGGIGAQAMILVCLLNYFLFFGPQVLRNMRDNRNTATRRAKFEAAKLPVSETLHRCSVCGITEVTAPNADFRVAEDGNEYCLLHLPQQKA